MRWWFRRRGLGTGVAGGEQRSCSGDGAAAELLRLRCTSGGRREGRATEWMEWLGSPSRRPDQGVEVAGRGALLAGVRPPRGRRWLGQGGRRARGGEGEGEQAGPLAGPKGRRGWPSSACPLFYFF